MKTPSPKRLASARLALTYAAALACVWAGSASAQQAAVPQWQFYVTPYLWIAGVSGTVKTPNPNIPEQQVDASFGGVLSHLDAIPVMGAVEARYGAFGVLTDFIAISVKADFPTKNFLFSGGSAKLTQFTGSALFAYRAIDSENQSLDLGIGVRAFGMSTRFELNPGLLRGFSVDPGVSWANPIIGARYRLGFSPQWGLTAYGDVGGGPDSQLTWQLLGTIDYRISQFTTLRVGYRQLQFQYYGNILRQNMGMSGPIITGTMQF